MKKKKKLKKIKKGKKRVEFLNKDRKGRNEKKEKVRNKTLAAEITGSVSTPELWSASWAFLEASEMAGEAIFKASSPAC